MRYFRLAPPTAGYSKVEKDPSGKPLRTVFTWHFRSDDPILTDVKFFGVPAPFAERLRQRDFSGYSLEPVDTRAEQVEVTAPVLQLVVTGRAAEDDFGMQTPTTLVVSERVVDEMRAYGMSECELFDYDPAYRVPTPAEQLQALREEIRKKRQ